MVACSGADCTLPATGAARALRVCQNCVKRPSTLDRERRDQYRVRNSLAHSGKASVHNVKRSACTRTASLCR